MHIVTRMLPRAELFRLLGDEDRLRLLALCAAEELTVGELSTLAGDSPPQITKKTQPLRDAGLLAARRDGTRTLLSAIPTDDAVVRTALDEGRALCTRDGSLARVPRVVAEREEGARRHFADPRDPGPLVVDGAQLLPFLPMLAPLLPGRALAVDVGTGDGELLPLLSPLYERVIGLDRSAARLARCTVRTAALGLANVRLLAGALDDAHVVLELDSRGGADLVVVARVLRWAARPQDIVAAAARLARPGGHIAVIDAGPSDDEKRREPGQVWLGFSDATLATFFTEARLDVLALHPLSLGSDLQLAIGRKPTTLGS